MIVTRRICPSVTPRLACVKPAASVHPEPGSNSSLYNKKLNIFRSGLFRAYAFFETLAFFRCLNFFKELLPLLPCSSTSAFGDCKVNTFFALANLFSLFFPSPLSLILKADANIRLKYFQCKFLLLFFYFFCRVSICKELPVNGIANIQHVFNSATLFATFFHKNNQAIDCQTYILAYLI